MAINAYVSDSSSTVSVRVDGGASGSQVNATPSPYHLIPTNSDWNAVTNKPFETVDGKTLSTEGGVLRFKTASYKDLTGKPSIEGVSLVDDKTFAELGMQECSMLDIEKMFA